ncbi:MAG: LysM peptidoglycan-binding domain-containing protein [Anaerolineaceae bacterium]
MLNLFWFNQQKVTPCARQNYGSFFGYNNGVNKQSICNLILILITAAGAFIPVSAARAELSTQSSSVTAYDLIVAMNTLRVSNGLPALVEDPIINAVAQSTAEIMAASQMSWHIGNVSGRLQSAGYGGGSKVWGTENFAVGNQTIDQIMVVWSDADHMIPAVNAAYCNVGAGVATSGNGMTYYILQAAYTSGKACGEYTSTSGGTINQASGSTTEGITGGVSQMVMPVKIAEPDADGKVFHVVQAGQSYWAIAITYGVTIKDIQTWNNLSAIAPLQTGQKLFIPSANTEGYATPTPVGMIQTSPPDQDGKIVHTVQSYQTLTTISQAYGTSVENVVILNGISANTPLQIGQQLVINAGYAPPTATVTLTPTPLSPLQKLTPEADGKYYHAVGTGENLTWIANLYQVDVNSLMVWNGITGSSVIQVGQKLLLEVTPPATITPTPSDTPTITPVPPTAIPSATSNFTPTMVYNKESVFGSRGVSPWIVLGVLGAGLIAILVIYIRSRFFLKGLK